MPCEETQSSVLRLNATSDESLLSLLRPVLSEIFTSCRGGGEGGATRDPLNSFQSHASLEEIIDEAVQIAEEISYLTEIANVESRIAKRKSTDSREDCSRTCKRQQ